MSAGRRRDVRRACCCYSRRGRRGMDRRANYDARLTTPDTFPALFCSGARLVGSFALRLLILSAPGDLGHSRRVCHLDSNQTVKRRTLVADENAPARGRRRGLQGIVGYSCARSEAVRLGNGPLCLPSIRASVSRHERLLVAETTEHHEAEVEPRRVWRRVKALDVHVADRRPARCGERLVPSLPAKGRFLPKPT
jgi:hypothetical protein